MSVSPISFADHPTLSGQEGELVSLRLSVEPRLLEDLLETLARLPFPVNPRIHHLFGDKAATQVEFPAYDRHLEQVREALAGAGLSGCRLEVRSMIEELQTP
jgi:hypothetical protein